MAEERVLEAVRAARQLLKAEGEAALSMRRLAAAMGIRAPSLYKHIPDKAALEVALVAAGLYEFAAAARGASPDLASLMRAYGPTCVMPLAASSRLTPPPDTSRPRRSKQC